MITTEKDAVRIPIGYKPLLPFYYVRMDIEIVEGYEDFEAWVNRTNLHSILNKLINFLFEFKLSHWQILLWFLQGFPYILFWHLA